MKKDYNSNYLQNTESLLIELKKQSYAPLLEIEQGTVADIGCGTGDDAIRLAELLSNDVKVVGLDHDPQLIELANEKLAQTSLENLSFAVRELDAVNSSEYRFQGIRAERLVQHLENPEQIINTIHALLERDGIFLMVETDWTGLNLYDSFVQTQKGLVNYLTEKKVNNGLASRNTIPLLKKAGFKNIELFIIPFVLDNLEIANMVIKLEETIAEAAEFGFVSHKEKSNYLVELRRLNDDGLFRCHMNMLQIQAVK
ncbi:MAG: hypothetical protein CL840_16585 [Crocinitomicaceae bacterium]|nr:hypothetical protein [Crocinitomicaceae bacterium]|tara:strand:- start:8083 stop:8850 length:768 start_codon:yes stop_codon:yes gene_type:complete